MIDNTGTLAPRARSSGLVVRELEGEVLIFDVDRDAAHCLNRAAGLVWKYCDGRNSVEDIRLLLEPELGTAVSAEIIWKALSDLDNDKLLEEAAELPPAPRMSRRDLMMRAGITFAVPVIASLAIPSAAFAIGSAGACGSSCSNNNQCTRADACNNKCAQAGSSCPHGNTCCVPTDVQPPAGCTQGVVGQQNCLCCSGKCGDAMAHLLTNCG